MAESSKFARIFEFEDRGQVVAMLNTDNEEQKPCVAFYARPPGLGVCHISMIFSDDEEGWGKAQAAFDNLTEENAYNAVYELYRFSASMGEDGE